MSNFGLQRIMMASPKRILATMTPSVQSKRIWGGTFRVSVYPVNERTYKKLGLRSEVFAPGASLFVMDEANFSRFCQRTDQVHVSAPASGQPRENEIEIYPKPGSEGSRLSQDIARAMYPLSLAGELDAVREERLPSLSERSRTAVLREDFTTLELKHELLHDLFLGPTYSVEMRRNVSRFVAFYVKWAYRSENEATVKFFEEINRRCAREYDLTPLLGRDILPPADQMIVGPNLFNYAGETFVYVWEMLLGHSDQALGQVPTELKTLLKTYPVS